jgi:hypothetical protein|tara:strand:+ start:18607 stop:18774 length:168 start_codon:yes stop_codon:yes gene_type:complete
MKNFLALLVFALFAAFFLNLAYEMGKHDQRVEYKRAQAAKISADIERMNEAFNNQ